MFGFAALRVERPGPVLGTSQHVLDRFGSDFDDQKASPKGPKWSQKQTKIKHKIQHKMRRLSRASWIRLGPVLGRFGVDLGVNKSSNFVGFVKVVLLKKIRLGKASWTELGPILPSKRLKKGAKSEPKSIWALKRKNQLNASPLAPNWVRRVQVGSQNR